MKTFFVLTLLGSLLLSSCNNNKNIDEDDTKMAILDAELMSSILDEVSKIDKQFKASYHAIFNNYLASKEELSLRSDIYWLSTEEFYAFTDFVVKNGKPAYFMLFFESDYYRVKLSDSYLGAILNKEFSHIISEVIETFKANPSMYEELNICNEIIERVFIELKYQ